MTVPVVFSGASLLSAVLWLSGYTAAGYAGLALTTLPGTWLALIWLPSGIGLAAVWALGYRIGLPLVAVGSVIINAGGIFGVRPPSVSLPEALMLLAAVAALDTVQTAVAARLWGQCGPSGPVADVRRGVVTLPSGGSCLTWSLPLLGRFVLAALAAPALTCWALVLLSHVMGYAPPVNTAGMLWETAMLSVADALGIVLLTPALTGLLRGLASGRGQWALGEDVGSALGYALLALVPVGLALQVPEALALLAPALALALLRHRLLGVSLAGMLAALAVMVLAVHGVFPGSGVAGVTLYHLNLTVLCLALTLLLLGVACEQMHQERQLLADRVALRTHELSEALAMAERMGQTDLLTGLGNRRALQDCLMHEAAVASRRPGTEDPDLSLVVVNLDGFRHLNEQYGAALGDRVLIAAAEVLAQLCRGTDTLFRSSAGEFTLICRSTPEEGALVLARKLAAAVSGLTLPVHDSRGDSELPSFLAGLTGATDLTAARGEIIRLSACFGIASLRVGEEWEHWQRRADEALQEARSEGTGRIRIG